MTMKITFYSDISRNFEALKASIDIDKDLNSDNHKVVRYCEWVEKDVSFVEAGWRQMRDGDRFFPMKYAHVISSVPGFPSRGTLQTANEYWHLCGEEPTFF